VPLTVHTASIEGDTYVSLVDAQAFVDARDLEVTLTEGLLLRAMDALGGVQLKSFDETPAGVIRAQVWLAYYIAQGFDPASPAGPEIKSEKVDVIETEYAVRDGDTTATSLLDLPNVRAALEGLTGSDTAISGRLERA